VLIYDGSKIYTCPIKARNLSGRTGRGDTCFSGYITERLTKSVPEALLFAAALVSLKMETVGPFKGTRGDVEEYIKSFYSEEMVQNLGGQL
jgi:sugar/nucleoside kinase (ribokinase family)